MGGEGGRGASTNHPSEEDNKRIFITEDQTITTITIVTTRPLSPPKPIQTPSSPALPSPSRPRQAPAKPPKPVPRRSHLQQEQKVQQQPPVPGGGAGASPPVLPPHGWRLPRGVPSKTRTRGGWGGEGKQRRASHSQGSPGPVSFGKVPGNNCPPWTLTGVTSRCISVISIDD
ncbi:hypothetical protein O3P69_001160 [Scylla paramamosain]|uniref:Uncharacterized protein n=1 Tax=Scylla paramamosain TaxID=85552 RepID=A0AAW0US81_SCYPA